MIVCSCAELDLLYVDTRSYVYITSKLHVPSKTESASENINNNNISEVQASTPHVSFYVRMSHPLFV